MTDVYLYQTIHLLDGFCRNLAEHLALLDGWARSLFGFGVPLDEEQARRMLCEEARRNAPVGCDRSLFVRLAVDDSGALTRYTSVNYGRNTTLSLDADGQLEAGNRLMLPSGADCAIALARYVAGDVEAFVELMNRTAAALGMSGTHFTNPTGLHDADHYSTARDMTTLFAHAMRNGTLRTIAGSPSHTMSSASLHDGDLTVDSTVFEELGTPFVAGGWIVAGKTGYTPEAGLCLATVARFGGRTYILVTAGAPGDHATSQADVDDARYVYGQIPGL